MVEYSETRQDERKVAARPIKATSGFTESLSLIDFLNLEVRCRIWLMLANWTGIVTVSLELETTKDGSSASMHYLPSGKTTVIVMYRRFSILFIPVRLCRLSYSDVRRLSSLGPVATESS